MANTIKSVPLEVVLKELQGLGLSRHSIEILRDQLTATSKTITRQGQVQSLAPVTGRTEGIGTTVTNINTTGQLKTADNIAADGTTFGRVNVTALTTNNVDLAKAGVTNKTAANIAETGNLKWRTAAHSATQPVGIVITGTDTGAGTASVAFTGATMRVPGLTDYVVTNGLALGLLNSTTYYIYFDDPSFNNSGTIQVSTDQNALFANAGRFYLGTVITPAGGAGPTTGKPGGTGGGVNRAVVLA